MNYIYKKLPTFWTFNENNDLIINKKKKINT